MRAVFMIVTSVGLCFSQAAFAETNWQYTPEATDELTGEKTAAQLMVMDDHKNDRQKTVLLLMRNKGELFAVIGLSALERLPPGTDDVSISYRADGGELQKETKWQRDDLRTVYKKITEEEARSLFKGEFLIFSFDQTGKRYRFPFDDDQAEELRGAVEEFLAAGQGAR